LSRPVKLHGLLTTEAAVSESAVAPSEEGKSAQAANAEAASRGRWWNWGWVLGLLLVIATFLAYQPAWQGKRIWDDAGHLTQPELRSLDGLVCIWTHVGTTQENINAG